MGRKLAYALVKLQVKDMPLAFKSVHVGRHSCKLLWQGRFVREKSTMEQDTREKKQQTARKQQAGNKEIKIICSRILGTGRQIAVKAAFGLLYALFIVLGDFDRVLAQPGGQTAGRILGWWLLVFIILSIVFGALEHRKEGLLPVGRIEKRFYRDYMYLVFAAICFICWLPYLLIYFPGWISNDSVWQLEQVCGWVEASNHHPYFHTMIIKCFFMLGFRIFGTYTGAVAVFMVAQMVFMACVYALVIYDFYKKGVHIFWLALGLFFYAALPMNGLYATCMGKDVIFGGVLLLYVREIYLFVRKAKQEIALEEYAEKAHAGNVHTEKRNTKTEDRIRKLRVPDGNVWRWFRDHKVYLCLTIYGFLICVLRSNGILVFAGTAAGMIIAGLMHKQVRFLRWKKILLSCVIVLGCYLVYHGPVLDALHVTQPDTIEGLTMPTQHIINAFVNGGEITEEELALLNQVVPMENIASYYNPYYFDIVKEYIRAEGDQQVIADNKGTFFRIWLQIGLRNPVQYLEAEVRQTCGYWMFDINEPIYEQYRMAENPFELTVQRKVFSYDFGLWMDDFLLKFQDFFNQVWSLGLTTWTMLACMAYALYRRRSCLPYLPYVMLFISLLLATPVHAEFRYTYGMFAALPFLLGITVTREKRTDALS